MGGFILRRAAGWEISKDRRANLGAATAAILHKEAYEAGECREVCRIDDPPGISPGSDDASLLQFFQVKEIFEAETPTASAIWHAAMLSAPALTRRRTTRSRVSFPGESTKGCQGLRFIPYSIFL